MLVVFAGKSIGIIFKLYNHLPIIFYFLINISYSLQQQSLSMRSIIFYRYINDEVFTQHISYCVFECGSKDVSAFCFACINCCNLTISCKLYQNAAVVRNTHVIIIICMFSLMFYVRNRIRKVYRYNSFVLSKSNLMHGKFKRSEILLGYDTISIITLILTL